MPNMNLSDEEVKIIKEHREKIQKELWKKEGILDVVMYIISLGNECAGGSGDVYNPITGKQYGHEYYNMADLIRKHFKLT